MRSFWFAAVPSPTVKVLLISIAAVEVTAPEIVPPDLCNAPSAVSFAVFNAPAVAAKLVDVLVKVLFN